MNFFELWEKTKKNNNDDSEFIIRFLKSSIMSCDVFTNGSDSELVQCCEFIYNYNIDKIIEYIDESLICCIKSNMILQFSSFSAGTDDITRILYLNNRKMNFDEIGRELIGERELPAMKKYGENHSKLALVFSLVKFSGNSPILVQNTNFGNFFVSLDENIKIKLLRTLALRDKFIQQLILKAKIGIIYFKEEEKCLSLSTVIRRRGNVKYIMNYILKNTKYENILSNIIW